MSGATILDGRGLPHALVHDALGPLSGVTTASRARGGIQSTGTRKLRATRAPCSPSVRAPGHSPKRGMGQASRHTYAALGPDSALGPAPVRGERAHKRENAAKCSAFCSTLPLRLVSSPGTPTERAAESIYDEQNSGKCNNGNALFEKCAEQEACTGTGPLAAKEQRKLS